MHTMSLVTVGTMAFDSIETPTGKVDHVIGGAATYIAWAASYLTSDIRIVSIIGGDFPDSEMEALHKRGVDTSGVNRVKDGKSFYWSGRYHDNLISRDTLVTDLNVLADFDPVLPESYRNSDYVMLGNLTPEIQTRVLDQLESKPRLIALDTMNYWMDNAWDELQKVISRVDILIINDEEARQMSGMHSLARAAQYILGLGPAYLVIKKGEHGALLFFEDRVFFAPGLPLLDVIDPTGAGDTFAGGFMGYLANSDDTSFENLKRAVIYGSVMASFCVEAFSLDKLRSLTKSDIDQRFQEFRDIVDF
jgi:sugar/nucleoside kinase (ribokinase family)